MTLAVCITTYNEQESIGWLVRRFAKSYPVYVVDDNSIDETASNARSAGAEVFVTDGKWGIGPSLMYAWQMALINPDCDGVLQIDAGGSHRPDDSLDMIEAYTEQEADLVIGSRFLPDSIYFGTPKRELLSKLATAMCNFAQSGAHYTDWTSGYRLFSRRCLEYLLTKTFHAKMHGWQIEVLAHAGARGLKIVEVPIVYIGGKSSFNKHVAHEAFLTWLHILNHVGWVGSKLDD